MRREDLERYLERGDCLGFEKRTNSDEYLGWILLDKQKPLDRYLSLLKPDEQPEFRAEQEFIRQHPYHVLVIELRRDVHESGVYESNEDYRLRENYNFSTLDEVESFVNGHGHKLEEIKWLREIDAP